MVSTQPIFDMAQNLSGDVQDLTNLLENTDGYGHSPLLDTSRTLDRRVRKLIDGLPAQVKVPHIETFSDQMTQAIGLLIDERDELINQIKQSMQRQANSIRHRI